MSLSLCSFRNFKQLTCSFTNISLIPIRGRKFWPIPPDFSHIELPPLEDRKLPALSAIPNFHGCRPVKTTKTNSDMFGPERVNNTLIHRQYGIMAITGGTITPKHISTIRECVNKWMNDRIMFAVWRIEPPWKPIAKRSQGSRLGGGKGNIHHYGTPVRAGHVIIEVGGHCEYGDVIFFLQGLCSKLPCDALPVSQEILDEWKEEHKKHMEKNINPFNIDRVLQLNMQGSRKWASPYDLEFGAQYDITS